KPLSKEKKLEYITAVQCLHRLPGTSHLPASKTRFDDFVTVHVQHRRVLNEYQAALREKRGFKGTPPDWDCSLDVASARSLSESPVFDSMRGLGGNGLDIAEHSGSFRNQSLMAAAGWIAPGSKGGCVIEGPFAPICGNCYLRLGSQSRRTDTADHIEEFRIEFEGTPATETFRVPDEATQRRSQRNGIGIRVPVVRRVLFRNRFQTHTHPDRLFHLHHAFFRIRRTKTSHWTSNWGLSDLLL
ncbi:hypothetical protein C8R45DRAFT_823277, partial [Mycena sanguinolenta]